MHQIYFILEWHSPCFRRSFRPSSGVRDCTNSNRHLPNRYCCLLTSVIRSSRLYIQQQAFVKQILLSAYVHHQEFKTVHTATGICQTDTAVCLLASWQQYLLHLVGFTIEIILRCTALWKSNWNWGLFKNSFQGAVLEHNTVLLLIHCVHHNDVKWIVIYISRSQWLLEWLINKATTRYSFHLSASYVWIWCISQMILISIVDWIWTFPELDSVVYKRRLSHLFVVKVCILFDTWKHKNPA